jgi:hypothetical protein
MSRLKGTRLFLARQRRLPVAVLGLERRLSLQHAELGVLIRTWPISSGMSISLRETPAIINSDADSQSIQVVLTMCASYSRTRLWVMLRP